ncbi:MAG: hypothetical protein NC299_08400 [Lachnospiraceae bacterium]|nr:hypothetical protein [Ruminococcus sp.]MCM1275374.1 hypothetical protein [Lachnospiraceae bacterium]
MTKFTLGEAIGNIDERQIQKALNYKRKANRLLWLAPAAACLALAVCIIPLLRNAAAVYPPDSGSVSEDEKNPGGATSNSHSLSYNGVFFEFDHCVIRVVYDENGHIIDPDREHWDADIQETLEAADGLGVLEYLGTGDVIGTDPNAELYRLPNGNILAVKPCVLEPYADAEEMLEKYPEDSIFEIFTFEKVDVHYKEEQ